ncbi:hypothetical protein [Dactylosporangium sp. CA-233914]|uniref:hypothetical protein n=1 Tax=Dactylosporangium sp. CA-233914 TaxID=3239934 RepID=UPI003D8FD10D
MFTDPDTNKSYDTERDGTGRRIALGAVAVVVAGAGYWFLHDDRVPLTKAEVAGGWCGPGGSSLSFAGDGAFTFAGVDNKVLRPVEPDDGHGSGSGTWALAAPIVDRKGPLTQVDMTFRSMNGPAGGLRQPATLGPRWREAHAVLLHRRP